MYKNWSQRCYLHGVEAGCIMMESFAIFLTYWISYHSACMYFKNFHNLFGFLFFGL
jgi:hypothetical protein